MPGRSHKELIITEVRSWLPCKRTCDCNLRKATRDKACAGKSQEQVVRQIREAFTNLPPDHGKLRRPWDVEVPDYHDKWGSVRARWSPEWTRFVELYLDIRQQTSVQLQQLKKVDASLLAGITDEADPTPPLPAQSSKSQPIGPGSTTHGVSELLIQHASQLPDESSEITESSDATSANVASPESTDTADSRTSSPSSAEFVYVAWLHRLQRDSHELEDKLNQPGLQSDQKAIMTQQLTLLREILGLDPGPAARILWRSPVFFADKQLEGIQRRIEYFEGQPSLRARVQRAAAGYYQTGSGVLIFACEPRGASHFRLPMMHPEVEAIRRVFESSPVYGPHSGNDARHLVQALDEHSGKVWALHFTGHGGVPDGSGGHGLGFTRNDGRMCRHRTKRWPMLFGYTRSQVAR